MEARCRLHPRRPAPRAAGASPSECDTGGVSLVAMRLANVAREVQTVQTAVEQTAVDAVVGGTDPPRVAASWGSPVARSCSEGSIGGGQVASKGSSSASSPSSPSVNMLRSDLESSPRSTVPFPSFPISTGEGRMEGIRRSVVNFGGLQDGATLGIRSSERIQAQHNADDSQLSRAMALAAQRDTLQGMNLSKRFSISSFWIRRL